MQPTKPAPVAGAGLALLGYGLFSTHDLLVKYLGGFYAPVQILFFSVLLGFPLVALFLVRNPKTGSLWPHHPFWMLLRVLTSSLVGICAFYAFSVLPLAQTYALLFSTPLLITLLSIPLLGEQVGARRMLAVLAGFAGVLIVLQPGTTAFHGGHLAGLAGAFGGALAAVIMRKIGQREKTSVMLLYPMLGNFLIMGACLPFFYKPMPLLHLGAAGMIALLGFAAMICMVSAFKRAEAVMVAPMQYSQILWAGFYGYILFGEQLDRTTLAGAAVIIASGLYIVQREWQKKLTLKPVLSNITWRPDTGLRPRLGLLALLRHRHEDIKETDIKNSTAIDKNTGNGPDSL